LQARLAARIPLSVIAGLSGGCTVVDCHYMVPVVDRDEKVRTVKAMGVGRIVPADIEKRFRQARGYGKRLARPAKDVELLIGMDNQGWMPNHIKSSQMEGDNLRLMQYALYPDGKCQGNGSGRRHSGECWSQPRESGQPSRKRQELSLADCMQVMMAMMLVMLAGMPECTAFRAFDCNNQSAQIEQYSLLDPEPCGNLEKVHTIERELYGEIVQFKQERLVQVTRCTASQAVKSAYFGFQSRSGVERYDKFRYPIMIEPADCWPFKMNVGGW
jgi:hypothetical protein